MWARLSKRPIKLTRLETVAIGALLAYAFMLPRVNPVSGGDFRAYLDNANSLGWYYLPWMKLVIAPFTVLPFDVSWLLWSALGIVSIWYAARVFGGNGALALLSYPALWTVWYGQVAALLIGFTALAYVFIRLRRYMPAGILLAFVVCKPQLGIPIAFVFSLVYVPSWYGRLRILLAVLLVILLWTIYQPGWLTLFYQRLSLTPPSVLGSITLWHKIGIWSILLWLLFFFAKTRKEKLIMVVALSALATPYYQLSGLLLLFVMTDGSYALVSNIGIFLFTPDGNSLFGLSILPAMLSVQMAFRWYKRFRLQQKVNQTTDQQQLV